MMRLTQRQLYYHPLVSSRLVGQAILPAAAFQAALGCGYAALWGRMESCAPVANQRCTARLASFGRRVTNPPQVSNLPHKLAAVTVLSDPN
jgi:hypothetical protein